MKTREEQEEALRAAYMEGYKQGVHDGAYERLICDSTPIPREKSVELYVQTFFIKQDLASSKPFFGRKP